LPGRIAAVRTRLALLLLAFAVCAAQAAPVFAQAASGCRFLGSAPPNPMTFCETFDAPTPDRGTRAGDLNATLWGVSRTNTATVNLGQEQYNDFLPAHLVGCGFTQTVLPPYDVQICNGRVFEAVRDGTGQPILALYPKQPFDFAGRTGTVVFDVSADSEGPHAAWPEFWLTDKPVPAPHAGELSAQTPYARHSFGFSLADACGGGTGVGSISVTRNYVAATVPFTQTGCVTRGSATGALNHFEVRLSVNRVEIWATDAGSSSLRLIAVADGLGLTFTRGLVWLEHVAYNACKFDSQCDHTLAWDNLGFDGPNTYRDLSFDVPDAQVPVPGGMRLGYTLTDGPVTLRVLGVYRDQTPTGAIVTFNWFPYDQVVPSFRVNGGPLHTTAWPFDPTAFGWRTIDVAIPLAEVQDGTNTIEFSPAQAVLSNVNLILIAGAAVPAWNPTPQVTFASSPSGVPITVNGQSLTTPATITVAAGTSLTAIAPLRHTSGGLYLFSNWSGALESTLRAGRLDATLSVAAAATNTTYTVNYQQVVDSGGLAFFSLTPCRLVDTRVAGLGAPALASGETRSFAAPGKCQVPGSARALSATLTATGATSAGHVRIYPTNQLVSGTSALNFSPGVTRANNAVIALGPSGEFNVRAVLGPGSTHLIVDVNGYYQ
jgi:hypothetical protein